MSGGRAWVRCPPGFNPRPRGGGDGGVDRGQRDQRVSIHAPAGWATRSPGTTPTPKFSFNPRPRGGGDGEAGAGGRGDGVSIHAPAGGGDAEELCVQHVLKEFQSTPPRGGRQDLVGK